MLFIVVLGSVVIIVDIKLLFFVVNEVLALNCVLYGSCTNLKALFGCVVQTHFFIF